LEQYADGSAIPVFEWEVAVMAKDQQEKPDPMWADKFEPDRTGEDAEELDEEAMPLPPQQSSTES
jgi:hypothetical protein